MLDPCKRLEREGFTVTYLTPDRQGRIDPETVRAALRPDTVLVSIMYVNNEIGVMQDVGAIGALCRDRGVAFHTDAAQAVGKIPVDVRNLPVDFLSFTAHKIYGPKGVGALYTRRASRPLLQPVSFGGGQERGLRPGTLATHQIVGLGAACEMAARSVGEEQPRLTALRERLWSGLEGLGGTHLNGAGAARMPGILNVSFEGVEGESLVTGLTDLAVSTGSACNSASAEPSYVLRALGRDTQLAQSSLRLTRWALHQGRRRRFCNRSGEARGHTPADAVASVGARGIETRSGAGEAPGDHGPQPPIGPQPPSDAVTSPARPAAPPKRPGSASTSLSGPAL